MTDQPTQIDDPCLAFPAGMAVRSVRSSWAVNNTYPPPQENDR